MNEIKVKSIIEYPGSLRFTVSVIGSRSICGDISTDEAHEIIDLLDCNGEPFHGGVIYRLNCMIPISLLPSKIVENAKKKPQKSRMLFKQQQKRRRNPITGHYLR